VPFCGNEYDTSNFATKKNYDEKEFKEPFFFKEHKKQNIVKIFKYKMFFYYLGLKKAG